MQDVATIMDIEKRPTSACELVMLRGELDLTNAPQLTDALEAQARQTVILDLSELAFLDSAGIRTIDGIRNRFEASGGRLLIVAPPESRAGWTFKVAGLMDETVLESVAAAENVASSGAR